jgi:hypothetical protein
MEKIVLIAKPLKFENALNYKELLKTKVFSSFRTLDFELIRCPAKYLNQNRIKLGAAALDNNLHSFLMGKGFLVGSDRDKRVIDIGNRHDAAKQGYIVFL